MFLQIPQNSQENTCARDSFLIKWQALGDKEQKAIFLVLSRSDRIERARKFGRLERNWSTPVATHLPLCFTAITEVVA